MSATPQTSKTATADALQSAQRTIAIEQAAMSALGTALEGPLGGTLETVVALIADRVGRVIVTGMGKSGHVGQKITATFASTGTPAHFVHPAEAGHGDLGMISQDDVIVALSWSGETAELRPIIDYSRRFAVPLVAITSGAQSALAKASDHVLLLPKAEEACPHGLAPTSSTLLQLAIGDAVAIALLERHGFTAQDFGVFHPGGKLGANLKRLDDIMHIGDAMPLAPSGTPMRDALITMTACSFGCIGITDATGQLIGIITDGDLRRHADGDFLQSAVDAIMTPAPRSLPPETLLSAATKTMTEAKITSIFVTAESRQPLGIVHMHDLLRAGIA
ncbi:MAG: KpsF/GutQ family sugar-phosphate isomerase [Pseudomonadota bacterium]